MDEKRISRREMFTGAVGSAAIEVGKWSPILWLLGFQFHRYAAAMPMWFGRVVWWVPK